MLHPCTLSHKSIYTLLRPSRQCILGIGSSALDIGTSGVIGLPPGTLLFYCIPTLLEGPAHPLLCKVQTTRRTADDGLSHCPELEWRKPRVVSRWTEFRVTTALEGSRLTGLGLAPGTNSKPGRPRDLIRHCALLRF
ncbi:hypothetical protein ElyMa_002382100 [Elysia marginata]|uniref:Uncharacterized protein n=1 Tax=Elysia marginata TaxID=1093978 RepID=A0AAV4GER1_9GAST|nr:hypothetical protein ElyMa_002382100 [Elysia marginata]